MAVLNRTPECLQGDAILIGPAHVVVSGRELALIQSNRKKKMKTETKLAPVRGALQKVPAAVATAYRTFENSVDRRDVRPLRHIDRWSDQAEVAYHEARYERA